MTRPYLPVLLALIFALAACSTAPGPVAPAVTPEPPPAATPVPTPEPLPATDQEILALPTAFRYQMALRLAGAADEPLTVTTGQYRAGAWSQITRHGQDVAEELVVAVDETDGALHSYTRAETDAVWTRWPGAGFDAGWGLASPFSVLRLHPLADQAAAGELDAIPDIPEPVTKTQTFFAAATIERVLRAGISAVATQAEERAALEAQVQPMLTPHTVTYWTGAEGTVYQAAATLLTAGEDGEPVAWLEAIWRFWDYDDPAIAIAAPTDAVDVAALAAAAPAPAEPTSAEPFTLDPATTLLVRVFATAGVPAEDVTVTVYPAGESAALEVQRTAEAQFALADGGYDVQIQTGDAEEWLAGVQVMAGSVASQDVILELGTLVVTAIQGGATPQVDIMVYPDGDRQRPAGWRDANPATFTLRAGLYDIEVALPDLRSTRSLPDVAVQAGQTVTVTVDIGQ